VRRRHLPLDLRSVLRRRTEVVGSLSEPLSDEEIEALYRDIVLTLDFYGPGYDLDLLAAPRRGFADMASAIVTHLHPARSLDVGCGIGALVAALRRRGVDAHGCDFSETFIGRARRRARPHLTQQDVTALGFPDGSFDLVTCMEVLEHLPVRVIDLAVAELARVSRGTVLVTTPSFGDDPNGGQGLPIGEPSWQKDAAAGRRFRRIVLDDEGRPHVGHLTLATYAWWTDRFAAHGLMRDAEAERAMLTHPRHGVARWRWNLYVLRRAAGRPPDR
jgi:ubiquinone/menaquinone biosynthesis C-methylase UbiE